MGSPSVIYTCAVSSKINNSTFCQVVDQVVELVIYDLHVGQIIKHTCTCVHAIRSDALTFADLEGGQTGTPPPSAKFKFL